MEPRIFNAYRVTPNGEQWLGFIAAWTTQEAWENARKLYVGVTYVSQF